MGNNYIVISPQKCSVTLFTLVGYPPVLAPHTSANWGRGGRLEQNPKILSSRWIPTSPSALTPAIVSSELRGPQHCESLCWVEPVGFPVETLVGTYKAIVHPILNYAATILFTKGLSHQDKLEVVQNRALRIATGYQHKAAMSYLRAETGVLPLHCARYSSTQQPSNLLTPVNTPPTPRSSSTQGNTSRLVPPNLQRPVIQKGRCVKALTIILGGVLERAPIL